MIHEGNCIIHHQEVVDRVANGLVTRMLPKMKSNKYMLLFCSLLEFLENLVTNLSGSILYQNTNVLVGTLLSKEMRRKYRDEDLKDALHVLGMHKDKDD